MVFQFRSSIIDTRYFVSLYFSLQRVREEYCVYIYIRFTKKITDDEGRKDILKLVLIPVKTEEEGSSLFFYDLSVSN